MSDTPEMVERYFRAADDQDFATLAACFTEDAVVLDEGRTHTGREAIRRWREEVAALYTFTTVVTGSAPAGDGRFDVDVHIAGDFPGGEADLTQAFTLRDGLIERLAIG